MGFVRVAKISGNCSRGRFAKFRWRGKRWRWPTWREDSTRSTIPASIAGDLWGRGHWTGILVTCPWHGWRYDVSTGKASHNQAAGVACYPVEVRGEEVFVNIGGQRKRVSSRKQVP